MPSGFCHKLMNIASGFCHKLLNIASGFCQKLMKTNKKHYAKEKYTIHNIEVYLSFEWFDNQKYLLYKYVKTKLSLK